MKNILTIGLIVLMMFSCTPTNTTERKAIKLITSTLKKTVNDWHSYEPLFFGAPDSVFFPVEQSEELLRLQAGLKELTYLYEENKDHTVESLINMDRRGYKKQMLARQEIREKQKMLSDSIQQLIRTWKGEHTGWKMDHTFRTVNGFGQKVTETYIFFFDDEFSKLTGVEKKK